MNIDTRSTAPANIDEYIARFPAEIQEILEKVRAAIKAAAPEATEKISYQMPTFYLNGNLVHFAAFTKHIGLYPTPSGVEEFQDALAPYVKAKGSIQFPLGKPIPYDLISQIAAYRAQENSVKVFKGKKKK
jgi:uncharacterized protein YdhG (YjbR/CyaY superfamily)